LDDFEAENTGNGLVYELQGDIGNQTPTLTNVRIRNSENSTRPNSYGIYLKNLPVVYCDSDTLSGIDFGFVFENSSNDRATPTLTNVRIRNSENSVRMSGIGIDLSNNVNALIRGCEIEGFSTGIRVSGTNDSEIIDNTLINNAIGMDFSSTLTSIRRNTIVATSQMALQMVTALKVANNAQLSVSKFTIDNYARAVDATNGSVELKSSIIWVDSPIAQPFLTVNAVVTARYCNTFTDVPVAGVGNINTNPMFIDSQIGDYYLQYESPMIDAGDIDADGDGWTYYEGDMDDSDADGTRMDIGSHYYRHFAHIEIDDQSIIQGVPSTYHADIEGHIPGITAIDWNFGDGVTSDQQDVIHTYADAGAYSVRLIVSSGTLVDTVYHNNHVVVSQLLLPAPQNVGITASGNDINLTWDPIVQDYYGSPVVVNHYLVYWSDSYDGTFRYLGDSGLATNYTDVSVLHDRKFYKIIGFFGDLRTLQNYLTRTRGVLSESNELGSSNSQLRSSGR